MCDWKDSAMKRDFSEMSTTTTTIEREKKENFQKGEIATLSIVSFV